MTAEERKGMKQRRSLVEGISPVEQTVEERFVFAGEAKSGDAAYPPSPHPQANPRKSEPIRPLSRMPLSTRIRSDIAAALKRASLERQLSGTTPNTLQDILEEALEPWLTANGYLTSSRR